MATVEETFKKRLFKLFKDSPNINALLEIHSIPIQDARDVYEFLIGETDEDEGVFSIDDGEGEQLEFVGELIGVKRPLAQEDPQNIFSLYRLGESGDPDNKTGFYDDTDSVDTGGYMTSTKGIPSITDPGSLMDDVEFRKMIRQKAASFRKKMTRENLFNYLIAFGARCLIDDETTHVCKIDPISYDDMNNFFKWYTVTKGFKPGGIRVEFEGRLRDKEPI